MLDQYHATCENLVRFILGEQDQLAERDRQLRRQTREIAELRQAVAGSPHGSGS